jgi:hypothetical protein
LPSSWSSIATKPPSFETNQCFLMLAEVRNPCPTHTLLTTIAEFLPPTREGGKAKITWIEPFKISPIRDVSNSALGCRALRNALEWARTSFPRLKGAKVTDRRFYC